MPELAQLETFLNSRLLGQKEAIADFTSGIVRTVSGPHRPNRTKAFMLLLGPTGTGKTEMVNLTSQFLYGDAAADHLERFDMGEYQHQDSVKRLLGAPDQPPLLGNAIDRLNAKGGGILLLDEIEKAFKDLLTVLLSFDSGRTTMFDGTTRDLSKIIVVLTSNLGAAEAARMENSGYSAISRKLRHAAEEQFKKEGVARFTAVISMNVLTYSVQEQITQMILKRELELQSSHFCRMVTAGAEVVTFLVSKGFSPDLGARNIRNCVEKYVGEALKPYSFLRETAQMLAVDPSDPQHRIPIMNVDAEEIGARGIGDRWSRALVITTEGDTLAAWPLKRSPALEKLLSSLAA